MAFHDRKLSPARTGLPIMCKLLILILVLIGTTDGRRTQWGSRREHLSHPCAKCDKRDCKEITPETCDGIIQKDLCDCCPVCVSKEEVRQEDEAEKQLARPTGTAISTACKDINCPHNKLCMLNIQGIPMCRCPTVIWCKREAKKQPLCGDDGKTYKSRCYLNIQECNEGKKIKVTARTTCAKAKKMAKTFQNPLPKDERKRKKMRAKGRKRKDEDRNEKKKTRRPNKQDRLDRKSRHKRRHHL